ncbi:uncharacterized protein [Primulina eburnea]|uniref:uncharacterized protein n=1 Tax=Primulina eburnea TaxID=1245227 RepID=UPI003C6C836C
MQSYIGVLVREKVKISYQTWKMVPNDVKDLIWESVNLTYNVDQSWKKGCLNSANNKWRQFKAFLTQKFILSKRDNTEDLKEPPTGFGIARDDWSSFVISRLSDDFMAAELCDDDDINRAIMWKKGRVNRKGEYEGDELKSAIEKIDGYVQQKIEGTLQYEEGKNDILTKALDSYEHSGRVRGVGGHITPSIYFNIGRVWKSPFGDEHILLNQTKELMEAKILISEQDACIAKQNARISDQDARIQCLEEMFKKAASNFDIEEKGSFSVKLNPMSDDKNKKSVSNYATSHDDDIKTLSNADFLQGKAVALTLGCRTNIVAYSTIVHVNADEKLFHGVPSPITCMHVSIDSAVDELAHLPFPIPHECATVGDAVGAHVAWPTQFVVIQKASKEKNCGPQK